MEITIRAVLASLYKPPAPIARADELAACKALAKYSKRDKTLAVGRTRTNSETLLASRERLHPRNTAADLHIAAAVERAQCWHLQSVQCCRQRGHRRPAALTTHSGNRCARRGAFARHAAVPKRCRRNDDDAARCCSAHGARKPSSRPKKHHTPSRCKRSTASWWAV